VIDHVDIPAARQRFAQVALSFGQVAIEPLRRAQQSVGAHVVAFNWITFTCCLVRQLKRAASSG
jgi:hypothetical protein